MKRLLFVLGFFAGAAGFAASAGAQSYPWCAVYNMDGAAYNCGFVNYAQCMATVSGIGGSCEQNLQYHGPFATYRSQRNPKPYSYSR
jgi:hypothetical protein